MTNAVAASGQNVLQQTGQRDCVESDELEVFGIFSFYCDSVL